VVAAFAVMVGLLLLMLPAPQQLLHPAGKKHPSRSTPTRDPVAAAFVAAVVAAAAGQDLLKHATKSASSMAADPLLLLLIIAHAAAAAAAAAGPKRISAGEQVCISYGSWPAEPFLLLWGFTPQPNAADAVAVFSSLQDMAACYFDQLEFKLTAGSPAEQLMHSEQFYEAMRLQLAAVNKNSSSSRRFSNMSVDASGIDGQLKDALAVLKSCVVAAAASVLRQQHASSRTTSSSSSSDSTDSRPQHDAAATGGDSATPGQPTAHCSSDADNTAVQIQQLLQIKLGELLVFRLQGLAHDLDQSCLNCREAIAQLQAHGNSSSSDLGKQRQQQPLRQQQQQQAAEVSDHTLHQRAAAGRSAPGPAAELLAKEAAAAAAAADSSRYQPSIEHLELICAYCCSKAALAWELADGYPIMMSGIFLV
jgi:hypothetical protein